MNTRALCLVLAAMSMAGCANFSGLDTQGQRLDANTLQTGQSLTGVTLSSAAWPSADWWKSLGASFNYNFDLWGGQRAAWEAALGQARAAEVDQQAARLTLAADVAKAYSDLGQAHIVRDLANDDLKRTRQMLSLSQRRLNSGSCGPPAQTGQRAEADKVAKDFLIVGVNHFGARIRRKQERPKL